MNFRRCTWLSLVSAALVTVSLSAQSAAQSSASSNLVLTITVDRPDAMYRQGERVAFTIQLRHGEQAAEDAEVQWNISKDGVPPMTNGTTRLSGGSATVTGKLDEPGFLV
jgi:cephalosporin-C deacetylase